MPICGGGKEARPGDELIFNVRHQVNLLRRPISETNEPIDCLARSWGGRRDLKDHLDWRSALFGDRNRRRREGGSRRIRQGGAGGDADPQHGKCRRENVAR